MKEGKRGVEKKEESSSVKFVFLSSSDSAKVEEGEILFPSLFFLDDGGKTDWVESEADEDDARGKKLATSDACEAATKKTSRKTVAMMKKYLADAKKKY